VRKTALLSLCVVALAPVAQAATYTVGPSGRQYSQLASLFSAVDLQPGDIVLVDGNATYSGGVVVGSNDSGTAANPVIVRWTRAAGQTRPLLSGGTHTIKFEQAHNVVFEGFDLTGGASSCIFNEADGTIVRDVLVRNCPSHGILGADQNSGSFTLEYSEVRNSGASTTRHSIYMQNDQVVYPDAVFRMRYNYVHSGTGGILMRSRYTRSEIYYNWFEGSTNEAMEFIGPDCEAQKAGWSANLRREDADVVGNVVVHTSSWRNAVRMGGDLVGRSQGRVRLVNNTIIFDNGSTSIANAVDVRLGAESLEMHNNVIHRTGSGTLQAVYELPASSAGQPYACSPQSREPWSSGRKVAGSNNWIRTGAALVPPEWTSTASGADPGLTAIATRNLRPATGSPLVDAGNGAPATPGAFPFPSPLQLPLSEPPSRVKLAIDGQQARVVGGARIDIGAYELAGAPAGPVPRNGSQPLLRPRGPDAAGSGDTEAAAAPAQQTAAAGGAMVGTAVQQQNTPRAQAASLRWVTWSFAMPWPLSHFIALWNAFFGWRV
jgi:hypothetical protein